MYMRLGRYPRYLLTPFIEHTVQYNTQLLYMPLAAGTRRLHSYVALQYKCIIVHIAPSLRGGISMLPIKLY